MQLLRLQLRQALLTTAKNQPWKPEAYATALGTGCPETGDFAEVKRNTRELTKEQKFRRQIQKKIEQVRGA